MSAISTTTRFSQVLPDPAAWDLLAREGWQLVSYNEIDKTETWEKDGAYVLRWRNGDTDV